MEKVTISVEVPKHAHELGEALTGLVKVIREQLKDGFQPGSDLPAVIVEAVKDLPAIVSNAGGALAEAGESKLAVAKALAIDGFALAEALQG